MSTAHPRSITEAEALLIEGLTIDDQADLIRAVRLRGHRNDVALGLVGWLAAKAAGLPDETAATTRARYRKILAELAADPTAPPRMRRAIPGLLKLAG